MYYKVGIGHDVPDIDLELLDPQPWGTPATPVKRNYSADNGVHDQNLFIELHFDMLESETQYMAVLQQFGLGSDDSAEVTLACRDRRLQAETYNGVALLPEPLQEMKWQNFFVRDIIIRVINLEPTS
jgi:hypothetical protein